MSEFILSGTAWFDGLPEPVLWVSGGRTAYLNSAARQMRPALGAVEGERAPAWLAELAEDSATTLELDDRMWLARTQSVQPEGILCQLIPLGEEQLLSYDRVGQIAGQMRLPLGNLIAATQLLERAGTTAAPEKLTQYQAIQRKNYHAMLRVLDNLDFLSSTQRLNKAELLPLDFGQLCSDVIACAAPLVERSGCTLNLCRSGEPLPVRGNAPLLRKMLLHFVSNELRAAGQGGTVTFALTRRGNRAKLTIRDDGAGFAPRQLPEIFSMTASADPDGLERGSGVGLNICRMIVQRHGGRLALLTGTSRERVVVELPLTDDTSGGALHSRVDYDGGLEETLLQLSDVLDWNCFLEDE